MSISSEAVEAAAAAIQVRTDQPLELHDLALAALTAAGPHMLIHVHHHDIEHHARSFNEGYESAVTQGLADDPSLAQDWLDEKLAEAWDEGHERGFWNGRMSQISAPYDAPDPLIGKQDAEANNPHRPTP